MTTAPEFDLTLAHRYFAVACFNRAWDLLDKAERTRDEDEEMVRLSLASHWHWTQRPDFTQENESIAHWQTSRIFAVLGQADNALRYAELCLSASQGDSLPPFCLGYAYEALARAKAVSGNQPQALAYIALAEEVANRMVDLETKQQLLHDLETIPRA